MGIFGFFNGASAQKYSPYKDKAVNTVYNLLFCDDLDLYKSKTASPDTYPFSVLFSKTAAAADLQKIIDDTNQEPRVKLLAYNKLRAIGQKPVKKELLAVIVEIGLADSLDVLASFADGTARYINQSGKLLVWEATADASANKISAELFDNSRQIISRIGPWNKPRKAPPVEGYTRISFLVSDGLYFGEGPTNILFKDPLGSKALTSATMLMQYIMEKAMNKS